MVTVTQKEIMNHYDITIHENPEYVRIVNNDILKVEPPFEFRSCSIDANFLGAFTYLGGGSTIIKNVNSIGRFCTLASNLHFGPVEHPVDTISAHPMFQKGWHTWETLTDFYKNNESALQQSSREWGLEKRDKFPKINIGHNVWIGEGVFIRQGVQIGNGSIIASRSVITKDVPSYSIVGGNPGKVIRKRYSDEIIERMENSKWWEYGLNAINNLKYHNLEDSLSQIEDNIANGAELYSPKCLCFSRNGNIIRSNCS